MAYKEFYIGCRDSCLLIQLYCFFFYFLKPYRTEYEGYFISIQNKYFIFQSKKKKSIEKSHINESWHVDQLFSLYCELLNKEVCLIIHYLFMSSFICNLEVNSGITLMTCEIRQYDKSCVSLSAADPGRRPFTSPTRDWCELVVEV